MAAAASVCFATLPWFVSFGPVTGERGGILAAVIATAAPGLLMLRAARRPGLPGRLHLALTLLALSILFSAGGNLIRLVGTFGVPLPEVPGLGLSTTLGIWALGLLALLCLPLMPMEPGSGWRIATDIVIAGLGFALMIFVIWTLPGLRQAPPSFRREIMLYNVMEAGNLVALNLILARGPLRPVRRAVWWLCATAVIETVYLMVFQYGIGRHAPDDRLTNCLFFVDYLAYLYAADAFLDDTRPGTEVPLRPIRLWSVNPLPIVAVLGVGGLLILSAFRGVRLAVVTLAVGVVSMTLLLLARVIGSTFESLRAAQRKVEDDRRQQSEKLELVGRLSGRVARIVHTLVVGVRAHADLLRAETDQSPQVRRSLDGIGDAIQKALALTERLLLASGHQRGDPHTRRLGDVVRLQQEAVSRAVGDKRVLIWEIPKGGGNALVAPSDVETIIKELVTNAGEATLHGGRITIGVREVTLSPKAREISPQAPPGRYSVLEVADSGRGIEREDLPHVFEPFFSRKPTEQSRGLGLSVVRGIAARYGGGLEIETAPGVGSRVRVYLPAAEDQLV
jgi:signal transduction histidine kinase